MHSGGGTKIEPYEKIYIEAPRDKAIAIFQKRFERNPNNTSCKCCGGDYSINEHPTLCQASAYQRKLGWAAPKKPAGYDQLPRQEKYEWNAKNQGRYIEIGENLPDGWEYEPFHLPNNPITLEEYAKNKDVLIIYANQFSNEELNAKAYKAYDDYNDDY